MHKHIVKRHGHEEHYDSKKVFASAYFAARNAHLEETEAENIANEVMCGVDEWIEKRDEVNSHEIFRLVVRLMKKLNKDAAFLYETHKDIS